MTPHSQQQQQHPPTSRTDADIIFEDHTATMVTAPTKNIFAVSFNTRQLGLDVECGGDNNNNNDNNDVIVAVTRVKIEEYKNKIHPGDIIISVGRIQLKNNRNIKSIDDVLTLISSTTERPLILEFARYRKPIRKQQMDHGGNCNSGDPRYAPKDGEGTTSNDVGMKCKQIGCTKHHDATTTNSTTMIDTSDSNKIAQVKADNNTNDNDNNATAAAAIERSTSAASTNSSTGSAGMFYSLMLCVCVCVCIVSTTTCFYSTCAPLLKGQLPS